MISITFLLRGPGLVFKESSKSASPGLLSKRAGLKRIGAGIRPQFRGEGWGNLTVSHVGLGGMEASRDCKKEPKQRKSQAEEARERHQVGTLNGKSALAKPLAALGQFLFTCVPLWQFRQTDRLSTLNHKIMFLGS